MLRKLRSLVALNRALHPAAGAGVGVPLVLRRHFVGMTPEGKRLLKWARRLLADWESLKQEAGALRTQLIGALRPGCPPDRRPSLGLMPHSMLLPFETRQDITAIEG